MKKALLFLVVAALTASMISSASLTLIQPNGGELCLGQQNYQIKWTAVNITAKIKLVLFRNNSKIGKIAVDLDANASPYNWQVGWYDGGMAPAGGGYKILISTVDNEVDDFSDAPFALKTESPPCSSPPPPPPPSSTLTIVSPNGGESWGRGSEHTISWTSTNLTGKVYLQLVRYNDRTLGTIKENLPASGSITWKAGEYPGNTAPAGKYVIRVRSMADFKIFDESDAPFNLSLMIKQFKQPIALKAYETVPGIYQNYPGHTSFPKVSYLPPSVHQGILNQITPAGCNSGGANSTALAGVYWFPSSNIQVAVIYRSRINFPLSQFAGKSGELKSAKLKMKRLHSIHEDANSGCGCNENLWVLKAPMTAFDFPAIGQRVDVPLGATEFTKDVTGIVKQWLDGTLANNGLLLLAGELPCSGGRTCFSCYEASLLLDMK
ncbi:MAG: hypothetical protein MUP71_12130 [Candidatus Aminicenantes bacterium]|nr:hypothetical protein [Candidatus Aminicenantes bacterium]